MTEKKVLIDPWQKATDTDLTNISLFPEKSIDDIVFDIGIPDQGYTGFPVVQSAPAQITVGNGRLYQAGLVYFNDTNGGQQIDLLASLPLVTRRVAAIVAWGTPVPANVQPRTFLTDPVTRASVARAKATELWRWANISVVNGVEGPDPVKPAVASNVVPVAWVILDTNGIVSIEAATVNIVPSVRGASTRLDQIDSWRAAAGSIIATLRSDLSALASRFQGLAGLNTVIQIAEDVARLKDKAGLPSVYSSWDSDHFIDDSKSDTTNVNYVAKIQEGIRFADAAVENDQLRLLNPLDPGIISAGNFILPAYDKFTRISQIGADLELNISNYQFQTVTWVLWGVARFRIWWGWPYVWGPSWFWWFTGRYDYSLVFKRDSDSGFIPAGPSAPPSWVYFNRYWDVIPYWYYWWSDPYWNRIVTSEGVNGSIVAETFLNAQSGYLLELGLYFSRRASTGDVHIAICKTLNGAPDYSSVIARADIAVGDIKIGPARTVATFQPTLLNAGDRYAFVISTPGNHYLWMTKNNKYTDGSLFTSTDGAWFLGDLINDISFDLVFAQFRSPRSEIQLQPLQLAGGIVGVDLNADAMIPNGSTLTFQIQQAGVWTTVDSTTPITGQPAILPFRAVFTGNSQLQPCLGLLSNSRVTTSRPRPDLDHIEIVRNVPSSNTIHVDVRVESWRDTHDTILCKIQSGTGFTTLTSPSSTVVETPIDDANARIVHFIFTMAPAVTAYKVELQGTVDSVVAPFIVSERVDVALTV